MLVIDHYFFIYSFYLTLLHYSSTDAQGGTTFVTAFTTTLATETSLPAAKGSNSHVAAIAGGAVGGAAALLLLIALGWCIARRRRKDDFDGDFDPDSVGTFQRGRQTLVPDGPTGAEVTPFPFGDNAISNGGYPPQMAEHNGMGMAAAGVAGLGVGAAGAAAMNHHSRSGSRHLSGSESEYPQTEGSYLPSPYGEHYQQQPYDMAAISPQGAAPTQTSASSEYSHPTASQPRSAKEREAYAQRYGNSSAGGSGNLHLATIPPEERDDQSSNVLVHQDGGRYRAEEPVTTPREIPPTYDSLPHDERPA
jgi:hypothetical protein